MTSVPTVQVIFLDAMGTLFELQQPVGSIYRQIAFEHGIDVDAIALEQSFRQALMTAHAPIFSPEISSSSLKALEKQWWHDVVLQTFQDATSSFSNSAFEHFFDHVFHYFSTAAAWALYPEVEASLTKWSEAGVELGIISNFDSRLFQVLQALNLDHFFQTITISSQAGAAKPSAQIFQAALAKHDCKPQWALHIGDQKIDDCDGAQSAGLHGIWLNRTSQENNVSEITALDQLIWPRQKYDLD